MSSLAPDPKKKIVKKTSRKPLAIFCIVVILAGAGYGFARSRKAKETQLDAASIYQTEMARKGDIYVTVSGSGTIEANATAQIVPNKISGEITHIYKSEGDFVNAGDLIATIDASDYELRYKQAEADMHSAQVRLEQANRDAKLYPTEAKSSLEQARAALLSAQQKYNDLVHGAKPQDIEQQKSAVRQAKTNYDAAEADFKRMKDLFSQGAISKQQLEQYEVKSVTSYEQYLSSKQKLDSLTEKASKQDIDAAKAQVMQAEANLKLADSNAKSNSKLDAVAQAKTAYETAKVNLETARKNLNSVRIVAPISGVIWGFTAVVGDNISLSGNVSSIGSIIDTTKLRVRASIDESDIRSVSVGQPVKITTDAFGNTEFLGKVSKIAPQASVSDGVSTYDVLIDLDQADSGLKPGMNADVEVLIDWAENVMTVPVGAVMDRNGRKTVMVMDGKEPSYRRVTVGKTGDTLTEIKSGISQGDMVVTNPSSQSNLDTQQSGNSGGRAMGMGMGMMGGGFRR